MATYRTLHPRLRIDDDGTAAIELTLPTETGDEVLGEWPIDYLSSDAQDRVGAALAGADGNRPTVKVPTTRPPDHVGTHPRS